MCGMRDMSLAPLSLALRLPSLPLRQEVRACDHWPLAHTALCTSRCDPAQRSKRNRTTELKSKSRRKAAVHLLEQTWSTLELWCVEERLGACHVCVNVTVCACGCVRVSMLGGVFIFACRVF
jgi:hypothetical protein